MREKTEKLANKKQNGKNEIKNCQAFRTQRPYEMLMKVRPCDLAAIYEHTDTNDHHVLGLTTISPISFYVRCTK